MLSNFITQKTLSVLILALGLTFQLQSHAADTQFKLDETKVALKQKFVNPIFYTQEQLQQNFDTCIKAKLAEQGKLADTNLADHAVHVAVNIEYQRIYNGETFGNHSSVASPTMSYTIIGTKNAQELFKVEERNLKHSYGFFGNIAKSVTMGLEQTKAEDENQFIDTLCQTISKKIIRQYLTRSHAPRGNAYSTHWHKG